ncbi:MAG TPA: hypothetical protein VH740_16390 [Vicinamibacterales bacterium]
MSQRHLRLRVLEALERIVKQFRSREELWSLRVPHEPLSLDRVVDEALGDDRRAFDLIALRSRTLLHLEWRGGATWDAWVVVLPSGIKLYCDTGDDESRILASGGKNEGDASDKLFLELLSESGGEHFGIEMSGAAPVRARSSIEDRAFLVDIFVNLFEVAGMEESVRGDLPADARSPSADELGSDFRVDVERWLERALRAPRAL